MFFVFFGFIWSISFKSVIGVGLGVFKKTAGSRPTGKTDHFVFPIFGRFLPGFDSRKGKILIFGSVLGNWNFK